jgi:transposase-like protein
MRNRKTRSSTWTKSRRWTDAEARAAIAALEASGESVARFAARQSIAAHRLYGWRRRLAGSTPAMTGHRFVEVAPSAERVPVPEVVLEIVLPNGAVIRVPQNVDQRALRGVLAAVHDITRC